MQALSNLAFVTAPGSTLSAVSDSWGGNESAARLTPVRRRRNAKHANAAPTQRTGAPHCHRPSLPTPHPQHAQPSQGSTLTAALAPLAGKALLSA